MKESTVLVLGAAALSTVLVACSSGSSEAGSAPVSSPPGSSATAVAPSVAPGASANPSSGVGAGMTACEVAGAGGIEDGGFNAAVWSGLQDAAEQLGIEAKLLETTADSGYDSTITSFIDQACSIIVTVGSATGVEAADATLAAANANPDVPFSIVDYSFAEGDVTNNNVIGQVFKADEGSFLAGYVAAGMTKTGTVATYGGVAIPPITDVMTAFYEGVQKYNADNGTNVKVLGWNPNKPAKGLFVGNMENIEDGKAIAKDLADQGADILMPVAGPLGAGSAAAATELGSDKLKIIGMDTDKYLTDAANRSVYLTSVVKDPGVTTFSAVQSAVDGTFDGGVVTGTLANGGVKLAPFHDFDAAVPQALEDQLAALTAAIIDGSVVVGQP